MAEYPALPLFTDAYMADTRHLTTLQHGAYLLLLMTAWRMPDCKLPDDDVFLARCSGLDKRTWVKNRAAIMSFWKQDELQKWWQGRLLDERNYVEQLRNKNSSAGKASALKRNNRGSTTVPTKAQPKSNPHTHTLPIPKESPHTPVGDFEALWKVWCPYEMPKGNKGKAKERYDAALGTTTHEIIVSKAVSYCNSCKHFKSKTQHVATWLYQKGYETEYQEGSAKPAVPDWIAAQR